LASPRTGLDEPLEPDPELAHWLVEAGKRTRKAPAPDGLWSARPRQRHARSWSLHRLALAAALAAACFQYIYLDTQLELVSLPSLIVFVLG
jgi:hypothetical protein